MRQAGKAVHRRFPMAFQRPGAGEQAFVGIKIDRGDAGGAGQRVAGIGVAVEQFDPRHVAGCVDDGIIHMPRRCHRAHGHGGVGEALGQADDVGRDAEAFSGSGRADAAETGDHFVEDQQDAMLRRDRPQPFEIAHRRDQHASGTRHRFDDDGSDGIGAMQGDHRFQPVGKVGAMGRLALTEGIARRIMRVRQVIGAGQAGAERAAVGDDTTHRNAAKTGAVIAALPADQADALALALGPPIGQRDLERGIDAFRARVGEEDPVQAFRHDAGHAGGELKGQRMAQLEGGRIIEHRRLLLDRLDDGFTAMAGVHAPQASGAIQHAAAIGSGVMHVLRGHHQARIRLEIAVVGERHPQRRQVVGRNTGHGGGLPSQALASSFSIWLPSASGLVAGAKRSCTWPLLSTRNLVKFHFTASLPSRPGACFFSSWNKG